MATTNVRGITIQLGADTSGLSKELKNVNKEISSTEKSLKDVDKLLKLDPTNTELLADKQKLLKERVDETKTKLDDLKKVQDEFVKNGGDLNSKQYMALSREIDSTEKALSQATKDSESFNITLEKVKGAMGELSNKAQIVADKTKALSGIATGLVAGLTGLGIKAMTTADDLNTLAQQSGLTTDELQKFQYASDVVDVSTDNIVGALKKMKKNMDSTSKDVQEAWDRLGISVKNTDGTFKDSTAVFYETLEALSGIDIETERDILAMQLFGKSADQLAGIIDDGGLALRTMGEEAENLGLILDQDTLDSMNELNDKVDTLKAQLTQDFLKLGATTLETLAPLLEGLIEKIQRVFEWLGNLDEKQVKMILTIAGIVASISPIASMIANIGTAVQFIIPIISTLFTTATGGIGLIITAIALITTAVIKNWDAIKGALETAWNWIKDTFNKIKTFIYDNIIRPIGNYFIGMINNAISGINALIRGLNRIKINLPDWNILGNLAGRSFGININEIGKIPMMANGGVLESGSAIVGERGAELLSIANGKAVVQPLTQQGITSGVANALAPLMSSGQTIVVQSILDGKVIAESVNRINQNRMVMTNGY